MLYDQGYKFFQFLLRVGEDSAQLSKGGPRKSRMQSRGCTEPQGAHSPTPSQKLPLAPRKHLLRSQLTTRSLPHRASVCPDDSLLTDQPSRKTTGAAPPSRCSLTLDNGAVFGSREDGCVIRGDDHARDGELVPP